MRAPPLRAPSGDAMKINTEVLAPIMALATVSALERALRRNRQGTGKDLAVNSAQGASAVGVGDLLWAYGTGARLPAR